MKEKKTKKPLFEVPENELYDICFKYASLMKVSSSADPDIQPLMKKTILTEFRDKVKNYNSRRLINSAAEEFKLQFMESNYIPFSYRWFFKWRFNAIAKKLMAEMETDFEAYLYDDDDECEPDETAPSAEAQEPQVPETSLVRREDAAVVLPEAAQVAPVQAEAQPPVLNLRAGDNVRIAVAVEVPQSAQREQQNCDPQPQEILTPPVSSDN